MNVGAIPAAKTVRSLPRGMRSAVIPEWTGPKPARLSALAMTVNSRHTFAPRDAMRPSRAFIFRPKRGRGECRVPVAPAASRALCVGRERTRVTTSTPESPGIPARNGFNGFLRALLGDRAVLPPSSADMVLSKPGRADLTSANLTPASGRRDHTTSPSAAASFVSSPFDRSQVFRPALHHVARLTLLRPPHPSPRS
jgi:hypothetical protein